MGENFGIVLIIACLVFFFWFLAKLVKYLLVRFVLKKPPKPIDPAANWLTRIYTPIKDCSIPQREDHVYIRTPQQQKKKPDDAWIRLLQNIENAWESGNYDWARQKLQEIAYSMVSKSVSDEQRFAFKQVMTDFAATDPLYRDMLISIQPLIIKEPGVIQSKVYKYFPSYSVEEMRYFFYFAHELGHLSRRKKGSSYQLFPPGGVIDGEADVLEVS